VETLVFREQFSLQWVYSYMFTDIFDEDDFQQIKTFLGVLDGAPSNTDDWINLLSGEKWELLAALLLRLLPNIKYVVIPRSLTII